MKRKDIAKAVALLLSAVMLAGSLTGCGSNADSGTSSAESASDAGSASEGTDKEERCQHTGKRCRGRYAGRIRWHGKR